MKPIVELTFSSDRPYADPFNEIEVSVEFCGPEGQKLIVPAYWAGGQAWKVRYAPKSAGTHRYRLICTDESNGSLHRRTGEFDVSEVPCKNPLYAHGTLRVAASGRYLEHADGTPFFWLGDTWWLGLCQRKGWGYEEFRWLAKDRIRKGYTVIQIVAGLYPDLPPFDPRGFNEAGYPWQADYARINPGYFDLADRRIQCLIEEGLVPCIVGAWGYHLPWLGVERMKKHWRTLVARWGAYPVIWCLAGEGSMPYYLSTQKEADKEFQRVGWTEIGRYVRSIDPYQRLLTVHPSPSAHETLTDVSILDFEMIGTGHGGWSAAPRNVEIAREAYGRVPPKPAVNCEVCYEGHMQTSWQGVQRFMFWTCLLSGAYGYTYGAGGIWQMNTREQPHGPSPHGGTYENTPWDVAAQLPGGQQLGLAKGLLLRYPWWQFEPHPDWVEPRWTPADYHLPYAAGVPESVRMVYIPARIYDWSGPCLREMERGVTYRAYYFDPITGQEYDLGTATADVQNRWQAPNVPLAQDWVLVLERAV